MQLMVPRLGALIAAAALLGMRPGDDGKTKPVKAGDSAPEISATAWFNGEATTIAEQKGKVVLLEFWASW